MRFLVLAACASFYATSSTDDCAGGLRGSTLWKLEQRTYKPFMTNVRGAFSIFSSSETENMKQCSVRLCREFASAVSMKKICRLKDGKKNSLMKEIILIGVMGLKSQRNCEAAIQLMNAKAGSFTDATEVKVTNWYHTCYGYYPSPYYAHNHHHSNTNNVIRQRWTQ